MCDGCAMHAKLPAGSPQAAFFGYGNDEFEGFEGNVDEIAWTNDSSLAVGDLSAATTRAGPRRGHSS
jgi:hypothetical protein